MAQALGLGSSSAVSFGTSDQRGLYVLSGAAGGFPSQGGSYLAISSGCADYSLNPNTSGGLSCGLSGLKNKAGQDMVQVTADIPVPSGAQCWLVDWKFLSEEFPEWVGTSYNDAFLIEVGSSNINISGSTISAPNNVAYDANGRLITINTTGSLGMTVANAAGTTYDGATTRLTTQAPIPTGASNLRLIFSVMDMGDSVYDSTAFIDNIRFSGSNCGSPETTPTPPNSAPSITVGASSVTADEGSVATIGGTYSDSNAGDKRMAPATASASSRMTTAATR